eukprot:gene14542-17184_t
MDGANVGPDYQKIEAILGKLDADQLRQVIIEMIKHNPAISDVLPVSIKGVITGIRIVTPVSPPIKQQVTSPTQQQQPRPVVSPTQQRHYNQSPKVAIGNTRAPVVAMSIASPAAARRANNNVKSPNSHGFSSLMDEIKSKVGTGRLNLRHVDTAVETENRRKDQLIAKTSNILKDIVTNAQQRQKRSDEKGASKRVLVDAGTVQGMRIWKKDFELWKGELQSMFERNINLTVLIYKILDSIETDFPFSEAMKITQSTEEEELAQSLIRIGFNVKQSTYADQHTEYTSVSIPTGIPVKLLLATIFDYMKEE